MIKAPLSHTLLYYLHKKASATLLTRRNCNDMHWPEVQCSLPHSCFLRIARILELDRDAFQQSIIIDDTNIIYYVLRLRPRIEHFMRL